MAASTFFADIHRFPLNRVWFTICILSLLLGCGMAVSWFNSLQPVDGYIGNGGEFVGRDFMLFYAPLTYTLSGYINDLYAIGGVSRALGGLAQYTVQITWPYPPHLLALLLPLAWLPYAYALALWLGISIGLLLIALRAWKIKGVLLILTLLHAETIYSLMLGQLSLALASLAGIGIALLGRAPLLAGLCFAIISIKPHIALLIPFALLLARQWRVLAYTVCMTLLLVLLSYGLFGIQPWQIMIEHMHAVSQMTLSSEFWFLTIYSSYRGLMNAKVGMEFALCVQLAVTLAALWPWYRIWRGDYPDAVRWLALGLTGLLITPYNVSYDAVWVLLPLMAWLNWRLTHKKPFSAMEYGLFSSQCFAYMAVALWAINQVWVVGAALLFLYYLMYTPKIVTSSH